jgi:hypothetical protein
MTELPKLPFISYTSLNKLNAKDVLSDFTFDILQHTIAKLNIHIMITVETIKHTADGQVLNQTPWILIHALLISHFLSGLLPFLMSL